MDLFSDSKRRTTLALKSYPRWSFFRLSEDVVFPLSEVAFKEKVEFVLLFGLPNQFKYFVFFLPIEISLEMSSLSEVGQSYTPLSFFLEVHFDDSELSLLANLEVETVEVVVDSELKDVDLCELLSKF